MKQYNRLLAYFNACDVRSSELNQRPSAEWVMEMAGSALELYCETDDELRVTNEIILSEYGKFNLSMLETLEERAALALEELSPGKMVENCRESEREAKSMTDGMSGLFGKIAEFYAKNEAELGENAIAKGVAETIRIKLANIPENEAYFICDCGEILKDIDKNGIFAEEGRLELAKRLAQNALEVFYLRYEPVKDNFSEAMAAAQSAATSGGLFAECAEKYNGLADNLKEKLDKRVTRYYKENLLNEARTFEEVLIHSVSKLNGGAAAAFADEAGLVSGEIIAMLAENGITLIKPQPRDMFNMKEHEILMAEAADGFAKGEIIKLLGSGYKRGNSVLLRANVIAAK